MVTASGDQAHRDDLRRWRDELDGAALFRGLADIDRSARRDRVYLRLAEAEERHAAAFAAELARHGLVLPAFRVSLRTRLLLALARTFGPVAVLPHVARLERADAEAYARALELDDVRGEEHANAEALTEFTRFETGEALKGVLLKFRRFVILVVGGLLFTVSLALARNVQIEGLFFGLLGGVLTGAVLHYLIGKVLVPLPFGRVWCGWACWTAALLDQLPYRRSPGWLATGYRRVRVYHFAASLALALVLALGLGYGGGVLGPGAAAWFLAGNAVYWSIGVVLAVVLRDNRAFCKYACPVSVILRVTSRPALLKVHGDATACASCRSKACTTVCPMDIRVADYIAAGRRVLSTECIVCQACVAVCPPNTLGMSFGLDLAGDDLLRERAIATSKAVGVGARASAVPRARMPPP